MIAKFKHSELLQANASQLLTKSSFTRSILLLALVVFTSACSTLPRPSQTVRGDEGKAEGQWRGKAFLKNTKTKKSGTLDLDLLAHEPDRLRIEALGPLGAHVASVAAKGNEVRISLTREKKFIVAPADRNALSRIVPVRISPEDLLAILFDRHLEGNADAWSCDRAKAPEWVCEAGTAKIERLKDEEGRRRFKFTAPDAQMDLVLTEAPVNKDLGEKAYQLEEPAGYATEDRR